MYRGLGFMGASAGSSRGIYGYSAWSLAPVGFNVYGFAVWGLLAQCF